METIKVPVLLFAAGIRAAATNSVNTICCVTMRRNCCGETNLGNSSCVWKKPNLTCYHTSSWQQSISSHDILHLCSVQSKGLHSLRSRTSAPLLLKYLTSWPPGCQSGSGPIVRFTPGPKKMFEAQRRRRKKNLRKRCLSGVWLSDSVKSSQPEVKAVETNFTCTAQRLVNLFSDQFRWTGRLLT